MNVRFIAMAGFAAEEIGPADTPLPLHGGRLAAARRAFPSAPEPFFDLSTGINPYAFEVPALSPDAFRRLPEPEQVAALEQAAAAAYGVADPKLVIAAPGSQALIQFLPRLCPAPRVAVLGPSYAGHAAAWRAAGCVVHEASRLGALRGAAAAVVCNPNNPDGRRHPAAELLELARTCGLLIVDEAFVDLEDAGLSLAPFLPQAGVIVLRSFGKAYGLAGLRLGFALAGPDLGPALRAALGPWPVSGPAIVVGCAALADAGWRASAAKRAAAATARLDALLRAAGLDVVGGTALFRLVASNHAAAAFDRLGRAGILVRRFPEHPRWLRFGLPGSEPAWQRLAAALAQ
jgi:cobalamin biosynthetic protein CobC